MLFAKKIAVLMYREANEDGNIILRFVGYHLGDLKLIMKNGEVDTNKFQETLDNLSQRFPDLSSQNWNLLCGELKKDYAVIRDMFECIGEHIQYKDVLKESGELMEFLWIGDKGVLSIPGIKEF